MTTMDASFGSVPCTTFAEQELSRIAFERRRNASEARDQPTCVDQEFVQLRRTVGRELMQSRPDALHRRVEIGSQLGGMVERVIGRSYKPIRLYLLNPAEWPILRLELRESPDTHPFLVALPFQ